MDKILIAGGGYADIPMIEAARSLGLYVITTGNRPDELGHKHSHEYRPCDFSDKEGITALARELRVDAICPCCNDFSALSAAYAAEKLGLPGHDSLSTLQTLMHKDSFHNFARKHNLPVAKAQIFTSAGELQTSEINIEYPAIVKPVDMTGGKGISRVETPDQLVSAAQAAQKASRTSRFLVEEYLAPDSYHHNYVGFIHNGAIIWDSSDNEHYWKNPYLVWGMSTPSTEDARIHLQIRETINKIANILSLKPGLIMTQHCVVNGELKLIEAGRRMPGNLHGRMLEYATGFDVSLCTIKAALGEDFTYQDWHPQNRLIAEHCIMAPKNGIIKSVEISPQIGSRILEHVHLLHPGDEITNYMVDKLGILLLEFSDMQDMLHKSDNMHQYVKVTME